MPVKTLDCLQNVIFVKRISVKGIDNKHTLDQFVQKKTKQEKTTLPSV